MNCQIIVFLTVAILAKEILGGTVATTKTANTLTAKDVLPKDAVQNSGARVQRQFGGLFGSVGSAFQGAGAGVGSVAGGIGGGIGDVIHGRPTTVIHEGAKTQAISVAINNAPGGTANAGSTAQNAS